MPDLFQPVINPERKSTPYAANFKLQDYLERIGFEGEPGRDIEGIRALMRQQLQQVPFENLDVLSGKGVSLKPEDIVDKIIYRKRGGYCFEVNGLFAMALHSLGIDYQLVAARPLVFMMHRPKTHLLILAKSDGEQWLCDLGYGRYGIRQPVNLAWLDSEIVQDYDRFHLTQDDEGNYLLSARVGDEWLTQLEFDLSPRQWIDFEPANHYTSTHPNSVFLAGPFVQRFTDTGRVLLFGDNLRIFDGERIDEYQVSEDEVDSVLRERFDLIHDGAL